MINFFYKKIKQIFFSSSTRKKITQNVLWQVIDKFIRLGFGLIIGLWIARYFGPELFGQFNYAFAFVALFGALASLGMDSIVTKDIVEKPENTARILGSSFFLKLVGSFTLCIIASSSVLFVRPDEEIVHLIVFILSLGTIFQSFTVIDFYYAAKVRSKYSILAKMIAFLFASAVKVYLLLNHLTLIQLAVLTIIESFLASVFLVVFYNKEESIRKWNISWNYCKNVLTQSWPLILSGFVIMIYMRIDQIMIGSMLGNEDVGIFSAAVRISEIWYFLPTIMAISIYPNLIEVRKNDYELYKKRYLTLFKLMNSITIPAALIISVFSPFIIAFLYGNAYMAAAPILAIHIWTGIFVFWGVGGANFYIIEGMQHLIFRRTLVGAILNVALNLCLIPLIGAIGAAIATLVAQLFVSYLSEIFLKKTRVMFFLKSKSLLFFKS